VIGGWRKLHNEELHKLYCSNDQVKEDDMGRACSTLGARRNAYKILVGKPEGKRPLGRPICRWNDNIKVELRRIA
jgi:hypothetical protein